MNASECCRTVGCNCAGTNSIEMLNQFMNGGWFSFFSLVLAVGTLVFLVLLYSIYKDKLKQREENKK